MILFWSICAALLLVALSFVVWPLWRKVSNKNEVLRDAANLEILRDQSTELEADLRNDLLTQDAYEQGKRELQSRLLEEVKVTDKPVMLPHNPARVLAVVLAVLLPLIAVPLYLKNGSPEGINFVGESGMVNPEVALHLLQKKVEKHPDDPNNLVMLARTYGELQRFAEATSTYAKLVALVPEEAQVWAEYADATAMVNNRSLKGAPTQYIKKALELDGNHPLALELAGSAEMESGDYANAIAHWTTLVSLLPPDNSELQIIRHSIQQARKMLEAQPGGKEILAKLPAQAVVVAKSAASISGKISLSPSLASKVSPTDTVYIFARDPNGGKPLAVLRKQVIDLPLQFTLDDTLALMPQSKLSMFDQVKVVARVSKSGNPIAQPGDLQGTAGIVKNTAQGLNIVIDTVSN